MYEVRIIGQQYAVVPKGYDPLRHGGISRWAWGVYNTRPAAERACETANVRYSIA